MHVYEPMLLEHVAVAAHPPLFVAHSLMSEQTALAVVVHAVVMEYPEAQLEVHNKHVRPLSRE